MNIAARFADPSVQKSAAVNLSLIDRLEELIGELELYLTRTAKVDDVQTYHRLQNIESMGFGPALSRLAGSPIPRDTASVRGMTVRAHMLAGVPTLAESPPSRLNRDSDSPILRTR